MVLLQTQPLSAVGDLLSVTGNVLREVANPTEVDPKGHREIPWGLRLHVLEILQDGF